jgi:mono/diheme cytochrome c family protein
VAAVLLVAVMFTWAPTERAVVGAEPDGAGLFRSKGCAGCHLGPHSTTTPLPDFPSLADVSAWADSRIEGVTARDYLTQSIAAPSAFISPEFDGGFGPTEEMPLLKLAPEEIEALVDYLLEG